MPGIVGLVTKKARGWAEPQLAQMVEALDHETFYRTGTWIDEAAGVYLGWASLEDSFSAAMPLKNERGDVVLAFSGQDFADPETVESLRRRGHVLGSGKASHLVHVYEEDRQFPVSLNGRFHGFLIDRTLGTATLFNDRYGMHRIYYHEANDVFYFAAELKAILRVRPDLAQIDPRGLGEMVSFGCTVGNRTMLKQVALLPHGSIWTFRQGAIENKGTYFLSSEWENQDRLNPDAYYKKLREAFALSLPRYFDSSDRIAMSLTGGLDTRMIMAWQRCPPGKLPCYTFGGTYRDCRDVDVARTVARICQQPYDVITTGPEFLSQFSRYAERTVYLSDGYADMSRTPALYVNVKAREIAPTRMAGIYGGEVMRRLRGFKPWEPSPGLFSAEVMSHVEGAKHTYSELVRSHPISFTLFGHTPQRGVDTLEESQLDVRCPYLDNDLVRVAFQAPDSGMADSDAAANNDDCLRLIADGNPALRRVATDRGVGGNGFFSPFRRAYLEFTFKSEYAYDYGMPQWVAGIDHSLSALRLERLFLGRHKFYHFRVWYRDALSNYVREMLLDHRTISRPYLNRSVLVAMVEGHLRGDRNYTSEIHKVLTLELFHRLFVDAQ